MNVLNFILSLGTIFTASLPLTTPKRVIQNSSGYTTATAGSTFFRFSNNSLDLVPLSIVLDFTNDSVYSNLNKAFVLPASNFRPNISGFEFELINTSGSLNSTRMGYSVDFLWNSNSQLLLRQQFRNLSSTPTTTDITIDLDPVQFPIFVFELSFLFPIANQNQVAIRWGTKDWLTQAPTSFNTNWANTDNGSTTFNTGYRLMRNGSALSTTSANADFTKISLTNFMDIRDQYFQNVATFYYDLGKIDADSTTLIVGFSAIVGILVNFGLMILNLSVLGVSLMDIFATMFLFVGFVWILKLIRG